MLEIRVLFLFLRFWADKFCFFCIYSCYTSFFSPFKADKIKKYTLFICYPSLKLHYAFHVLITITLFSTNHNLPIDSTAQKKPGFPFYSGLPSFLSLISRQRIINDPFVLYSLCMKQTPNRFNYCQRAWIVLNNLFTQQDMPLTRHRGNRNIAYSPALQ